MKSSKNSSSEDKATKTVELAVETVELNQGCELDQFLIEFEFKRHLQVQVRVQRFLFFEFGKNDRVQVRVHSPVQNIP